MKQQQTTDRAALRAPEFFPELGSFLAEIDALDQRLAQIQERRTELNAALTTPPAAPEAQGASVLDRARAVLHGKPIEQAPQTALQLLNAMREELAQLAREADLLQTARQELIERSHHARERATAERRMLPDLQNAAAELQAACRVLLQVHAKGQALAQRLGALGFNLVEPHGWSGAHLPAELAGLLEQAAEGREVTLPEPAPLYRGPLVKKIEQRSFIRSASSF